MKTPAAPVVLSLTDVGKRFGDRWVMRRIALELRAGEFVALLGESGAGKSTLLNLIAGLEPADEGQIQLAGQSVQSLDPDASARLRSHALGFVFQAFHLIAHMSVVRNVAIPLLLTDVPQASALQRAESMLERVGLAGRGASLPTQLSGGEQQRVALARALVHEPSLVLADEPTGNLDPATAASALRLLAEQARSRGVALLMVTHSEHAAGLADRRLHLGPDGLQAA